MLRFLFPLVAIAASLTFLPPVATAAEDATVKDKCIDTCQSCVTIMECDSPLIRKCGDTPCCQKCAAACEACRNTCRVMAGH